MLWCPDCDESVEGPHCFECGAVSVRHGVETSGERRNVPGEGQSVTHLLDVLQSPDAVPQALLNATIFNSLGDDLRAAIEASLNEQGPSREIGQSFLSSLGRLKLNEAQSLLDCIVLTVGPLSCNLVLAGFSPVFTSTLMIEEKGGSGKRRLVLADPSIGDTDELRNDPEMVQGSILLMERGGVSFAKKALLAQRSGAAALIIAQTYDKWPFMPEDSSNEIGKTVLTIPIMAMSRQDSSLITRLIEEAKATEPLACSLSCTRAEETCSICYECMTTGAEVFKLPCNHIFHCDCLGGWIASHNTCPLCRLAMPTKSDERTDEQARRRAANSAMLY